MTWICWFCHGINSGNKACLNCGRAKVEFGEHPQTSTDWRWNGPIREAQMKKGEKQ